MSTTLARELGLLIALKALLLTVIYLVLFGPGHRLAMDDRGVEKHLLPPQSTPSFSRH